MKSLKLRLWPFYMVEGRTKYLLHIALPMHFKASNLDEQIELPTSSYSVTISIINTNPVATFVMMISGECVAFMSSETAFSDGSRKVRAFFTEKTLETYSERIRRRRCMYLLKGAQNFLQLIN